MSAFVRVLSVICEKHGQLGCWGTPNRYTRVPNVLVAADDLRTGKYTCRTCRRAGVERPTVRYETEPVTDAYMLKRRPQMARDRAKLEAWAAASERAKQ